MVFLASMGTQRVIVTSGTGKAGRWIIEPLETRGLLGTLTEGVGEATAAMFHPRDGAPIPPSRSGDVPSPEDHDRVEARFDHPEDGLRSLWSSIGRCVALISNRRAKELLGWKQQYFSS